IPDIATAAQKDTSGGYLTIYLGLGDGSYQPVESFLNAGGRVIYSSMATGDFNGDHHLDLALCKEDGGTQVFLGNGDGTFNFFVKAPPPDISNGNRVLVSDVNNDGLLDLAAIDQQPGLSSNAIDILLGQGDGTFARSQQVSTTGDAVGFVIGDFDNDGYVDLATVSSTVNSVTVW